MIIEIPKYYENDDTVKILKFRASVKKTFILSNIFNGFAVLGELFFAFLIGLSGIPLIGAIVLEFIYFLSVVRNGQEKAMKQYTTFQILCTILFALRVVMSFSIVEGIIFAIYGVRMLLNYFVFRYYIKYLKKLEVLREEQKKMEKDNQYSLRQKTFANIFLKKFKSSTKTPTKVTNLTPTSKKLQSNPPVQSQSLVNKFSIENEMDFDEIEL
uniref:Transporter n=1 Tax=Strongyloides venezuelensis TaxID=75913 RepID=A0A0K0FUB0_STRVS